MFGYSNIGKIIILGLGYWVLGFGIRDSGFIKKNGKLLICVQLLLIFIQIYNIN
jgi:hypothetical protein